MKLFLFLVAVMSSSFLLTLALLILGAGKQQEVTLEKLTRLKVGMTPSEAEMALGVGILTTYPSKDLVVALVAKTGFCTLFWPQKEITLLFRDNKLIQYRLNTVFQLAESESPIVPVSQ